MFDPTSHARTKAVFGLVDMEEPLSDNLSIL